KVIAMGTLAELRTLVGDADIVRVGVDDTLSEDALAAVSSLPGVQKAERADSMLEALATDGGGALAGIISALNAAGEKVHSVEVIEPNLESVFLHLTGKSLRD
ncbi:MAG: DUF4162 domain-containing protein, partial [Actinomycetota bacterium]|nr:DUF4162 domain-containing protein [Actinomycetota bacterium]